MFFLLSSTALAVLVVSFHAVLARSRRNPEMFSGEWLAMLTAVFYTGGFSGAFMSICAAAVGMAPTLLTGVVVGTVTSIVIVVAISYLIQRTRLAAPGAPIPG